jgi:hypothetical protein
MSHEEYLNYENILKNLPSQFNPNTLSFEEFQKTQVHETDKLKESFTHFKTPNSFATMSHNTNHVNISCESDDSDNSSKENNNNQEKSLDEKKGV